MLESSRSEALSPARVLVFNVDDGHFCIHLDWVEAVYQRADAPLHSLKGADGANHLFLLHRGQPAWVLELREAFGLSEVLGTSDRSAFAVIRTGSALWAMQVDACVGVRDLDLSSRVPVPASLLRDGGFPVGHLVEIDGRIHVLLEPSRIPSNTLRDALDPLLESALAFRDRQEKLVSLAAELRHRPTLGGLKAFGRLCRRNGQTRTAAAVRTVVRTLETDHQSNDPVQGELGTEALLRDLIALASMERTGELQFQIESGAASIYFDRGRIADAVVSGEWGREALKEILANREGLYEFIAQTEPVKPQRLDTATLWTLMECLEQLAEERRARHLRA